MSSNSTACDGTIKRKKLTLGTIALVLSVIFGSLVPLSAQAPAKQGEVMELRVAVFIAPPMVMEQNGSLTGFSIDLWNAIATRLKVKTIYQIMPDASAMEEAMRSKSADLIPALAITSARDDVFDFSYPTLETGLQIMVRETGATQGPESRLSPVLDMLRLLFSRTTIEWLGVGFLLVLIPAHIIWFLERRQKDGVISNRNYFPGIFEACYWGLATLAAQVESMPRQWLARGLAILWMFASVVFIASYTAQLTTTLTVEQIRGAIEGPGDLPGKQIATITSSIATVYLREQKAEVQEFPSADQVFRALLDKKVDAVVMQAPLLHYYAAHEGKGLVKVVGPEFDRRPVAIEVQLDSPLRKRIDRVLIALREDGTYQQIYDKWFGGP
jgi:polar amino acid transport system substrate-binding protein